MVSHLAAVFAESPLLQALWGFLVVNGTRGLALFVLAWTVLKLCRGLSCEVRHLIWFLVIVSSLVVPIAWLSAPTVRLSVPVTIGRGTAPLAAVVPFTARGQFLEIMTVPGTEIIVADYWGTLLRRFLPHLLGGIWIAGALFFLQRLVAGRIAASMLLRRARPAGTEHELLGALCRELGIRPTVTLALCRECGVPFTFGIFRPVVLLPEAGADWPRQRLGSVLIHELTHVRRRECLYNSICAAICAVLWFLPVLWLAYSAMRREAEKSSDRSVLRHGVSPTAYAADLVELVHGAPGLVLAPGTAIPLGRKRFIRERIKSILAFRRQTASRRPTAARVVVAAVLCCLLALVAMSGASVPGDRPLVGSWYNPGGPSMHELTWTADGRVFLYFRRAAATPSLVGRYTIETRWVDAEGCTWYHVVEHLSPPPYREGLKWPSYVVVRIDPEGTRLEYNGSPLGYAEKLTVGWYHVLYRDTKGKR